jgi:hypothetical protein
MLPFMNGSVHLQQARRSSGRIYGAAVPGDMPGSGGIGA